MGAGRTEMMRSLFGVDKADNEIEIKGQTVSITSPIEAMKHGLAFITENRKEEGLILDSPFKTIWCYLRYLVFQNMAS